MTYRVKETFLTLQGEGMNAGRAAVFCRFAGCNLWTGRESQRAFAPATLVTEPLEVAMHVLLARAIQR